MSKSTQRSVTTTFRTLPGVRDALQIAAERENRSMSNLMEHLAIEHCRSLGIPIAELETAGGLAAMRGDHGGRR